MGHIHTKPGQHDLTASAFVVRLDTKEPGIYLHLHKRIGKLMHFGGHVELHENPWQAIIREIKEEAGYDAHQLQLLQPKKLIKKLGSDILIPYPVAIISAGYYGIQDKNHFHDDLCFAFVAKSAPSSLSFDGESKELRLFNRQELETLGDEEIVPALREVGLFVFDVCLPEWDQIPADKI